ncbi:hypothetical protein ACFL59_03585 [Planctomycetota bacterium]
MARVGSAAGSLYAVAGAIAVLLLLSAARALAQAPDGGAVAKPPQDTRLSFHPLHGAAPGDWWIMQALPMGAGKLVSRGGGAYTHFEVAGVDPAEIRIHKRNLELASWRNAPLEGPIELLTVARGERPPVRQELRAFGFGMIEISTPFIADNARWECKRGQVTYKLDGKERECQKYTLSACSPTVEHRAWGWFADEVTGGLVAVTRTARHLVEGHAHFDGPDVEDQWIEEAGAWELAGYGTAKAKSWGRTLAEITEQERLARTGAGTVKLREELAAVQPFADAQPEEWAVYLETERAIWTKDKIGADGELRGTRERWTIRQVRVTSTYGTSGGGLGAGTKVRGGGISGPVDRTQTTLRRLVEQAGCTLGAAFDDKATSVEAGTEARTVNGRSFQCDKVTILQRTQDGRRTRRIVLWLSPEVLGPGLVRMVEVVRADEQELLRIDSVLAGFGRKQNVDWGMTERKAHAALAKKRHIEVTPLPKGPEQPDAR